MPEQSCIARRLSLALSCGSLEPVTIEDLCYSGSSFQFPNLDFLYSNSCFIHTNQPFTWAIKLLVLLTKTAVWLIQKALIVSKLLTWEVEYESLRTFKFIRDPNAFELMADDTRIRVVYLLRAKEMTVGQIHHELQLTPQAIYHHIRKLLNEGLEELAKKERVGHFIKTYYRP